MRSTWRGVTHKTNDRSIESPGAIENHSHVYSRAPIENASQNHSQKQGGGSGGWGFLVLCKSHLKIFSKKFHKLGPHPVDFCLKICYNIYVS
jgi:hypothetical protein